MASLQELKEELARREAPAPTDFGQKVEEVAGRPAVPITIDGIPFNEALEDSPAAQIQKSPENRLDQLKAELSRRNAARDPRILRDPVPTGVREIDLAGQRVEKQSVLNKVFPDFEDIPAITDLEPDSRLAIQARRAADGVDFMSGIPAGQRAKIAISPNVPALRTQAITDLLGNDFAKIPEGLEPFRYDAALDEFQFLKEDFQQPGKFRWTSLDGSGLELGDLSDMLNLGEIGDIVGMVLGGGKSKGLKFIKSGNLQAAVGVTGGATLGRVVGDAASIAIHRLRGGELPTKDQLISMGWDNAQIQALGVLVGEPLAFVGRRVATAAQRIDAKVAGKQAVTGLSAREVDEANVNIEATRKDMRHQADAIGRQDLAVTVGTASRSLPILHAEANALKFAGSKTKQEFAQAVSQNKRATEDFIEATWGGNKKFLGNESREVIAVNDAIGTHGQIIVAQTDDGIIHFAPKADPSNGVKIRIEEPYWQIRGTRLDEKFRGVGLGQEIYHAAAAEAERNGKRLVSDTQVSEDALEGIWRKLDGSEQFGKLKWNKNVETFTDGEGRSWVRSLNDQPVVGMRAHASTTEALLRRFTQPGRGAAGRFEAAPEFGRFLRSPGVREVATFQADLAKNPMLRQRAKEAVFADYEKNVIKTNSKGQRVFDSNAFQQWKKDTRRVNELIFDEREMLSLTTVSGFRPMLNRSRARMDSQVESLARALGTTRDNVIFKDPSVRPIWAQMKGRDSRSRKRTMRILDSMGVGDTIRGMFREDLKTDLLLKSNASNFKGFKKWFRQNRQLIEDVTGNTQYINDLRVIENTLARRSDRGMVLGQGADANPTALALTRVIFGPLSRVQRFFSAGRRGQLRSRGADIRDLMTDPDALRQLIAIRTFEINSRRVARTVQDLGLLENFGIDGETFDFQDSTQREELADAIKQLFYDSFTDAPVE